MSHCATEFDFCESLYRESYRLFRRQRAPYFSIEMWSFWGVLPMVRLFARWRFEALNRNSGHQPRSDPVTYNSIIPRFNPIMAACVRSLAPNLERIFLTRPLTVSSVIES